VARPENRTYMYGSDLELGCEGMVVFISMSLRLGVANDSRGDSPGELRGRSRPHPLPCFERFFKPCFERFFNTRKFHLNPY
jgi:hypothetical protein